MNSILFPIIFAILIPLSTYFSIRWFWERPFIYKLSVVLFVSFVSWCIANCFALNEPDNVRNFVFSYGAFFWVVGGLIVWLFVAFSFILTRIFKSKNGKIFIGGLSERCIEDNLFMGMKATFPFGRMTFKENHLKLDVQPILRWFVDISFDAPYNEIEVKFSNKFAYIIGYRFSIKRANAKVVYGFSSLSKSEARKILKNFEEKNVTVII